MNDLKFAFRQLLKNPGFTAVAVLTLALGIGANTAIFSLINAAMLKALPVKNPESIVLLGSRGKEDNKTDFGFYYPVFRKLREQNQFFDDVAAFASVPLNVRIDGQPEPMVPGQLISGSYLSLLGVNAVAGRNIAAEDDQVPGGHPVAMISYGYWQRRFARAPSAIGKVVQLNGTSFTIVGVAPPRFFGMEVGSAPEIMAPLMMQPQMMPTVGSWLDRPVNVVNWLHVVGRLKPGTTREQAQSAA
ncbi:MAG TPA: ABC transporter permease, partial [Verrucomicrobiae bacterium]|nr:ABC transporter permease [Verrucomicrobiae bacterium]